ncbi:MAG: S8 family serine peptidase [Solirubrobacterales bacterium]|nr:S8 family serine peptidase [Solirubrobacterales bacterium]
MRRALVACASGCLLALLPVAPTAASASADGGAVGARLLGGGLSGRLLVTLRQDTRAHASAATAVAARAGVRLRRRIPQLRTIVVGPATGATARRLRADPRVSSVRAERRFSLRYVPNDPAFTTPEVKSPGTMVEWWAQRQGLPDAWELTHGEGARVAVIDTGVDAGHPELADRIVDSVDFDDDPRHGPATTDEVGHGTHVASLACAAPDNATGLAGAGLGCGLLIAKTDLTESSVARSLVWAADRGAQAINMSFGTDGKVAASSVTIQALQYAASKGAVLVAAAADDPVEQQGDPANVLQPTGTGGDLGWNLGLTVTAATGSDQRARFAGRGTQISMAAYGTYGGDGPTGILGAFPAGQTELERPGGLVPGGGCRCRATLGGDDRYAHLQGTSMAAPMVAGVAALMRQLNPDLAAAEVVRLMKEQARRAPGGGWTADLGWGILDARAAVRAAAAIDRRPPVSRMFKPKVRGRSILLKWSGVDTAPAGVEASGVDHYELWRSANRRPARRMQIVKRTTLRLRGKRGSKYTFFTVAVDRAGNRETAPSAPDVRIAVRRR